MGRQGFLDRCVSVMVCGRPQVCMCVCACACGCVSKIKGGFFTHEWFQGETKACQSGNIATEE